MAGMGPFSEVVLCQTPCSVPAAVSSVHALKESQLRRYEAPLDDADEEDDEDEEEDEDGESRPAPLYSPSTCLGLCWEPPCDHGSEITSYLIDLGERQPIVVGPVTRHVIEHLQPDTSYRSALFTVRFRWFKSNLYVEDLKQGAQLATHGPFETLTFTLSSQQLMSKVYRKLGHRAGQ